MCPLCSASVCADFVLSSLKATSLPVISDFRRKPSCNLRVFMTVCWLWHVGVEAVVYRRGRIEVSKLVYPSLSCKRVTWAPEGTVPQTATEPSCLATFLFHSLCIWAVIMFLWKRMHPPWLKRTKESLCLLDSPLHPQCQQNAWYVVGAQ